MEYTDRENYFSIYMKKKANSSQKKKKYGQAIKNSVTTQSEQNATEHYLRCHCKEGQKFNVFPETM